MKAILLSLLLLISCSGVDTVTFPVEDAGMTPDSNFCQPCGAVPCTEFESQVCLPTAISYICRGGKEPNPNFFCTSEEVAPGLICCRESNHE